MIWDRMLNAELAEPAIREVHLNFATDQPLRADREDISHHQHPDHQFRIDRRPTHGRIMRCKFAAEPGKIEAGEHRAFSMLAYVWRGTRYAEQVPQYRSCAPDDL